MEVTEITSDNRVIRGAGLRGGPTPAEGPGVSPKEETQQMLTDDSEVLGWTKGQVAEVTLQFSFRLLLL